MKCHTIICSSRMVFSLFCSFLLCAKKTVPTHPPQNEQTKKKTPPKKKKTTKTNNQKK